MSSTNENKPRKNIFVSKIARNFLDSTRKFLSRKSALNIFEPKTDLFSNDADIEIKSIIII